MDIDLIIATSGHPPEAPASLSASALSSFHSAGSFGASSTTSASPNSFSMAATEDSNMYYYAASPQSLPSAFGGAPLPQYGYAQAASFGGAVTEPTKPYKRPKRNSSTTSANSSSASNTSNSASPASATGSMESMMFGWKLNKTPKNTSNGTEGHTEGGRKRAKSAKVSPSIQQPPRLPYQSPLHLAPKVPFVPPVNYGVYDPTRLSEDRRFHRALTAPFPAAQLPPAIPAYLAMAHSQFSSAPASPTDYSIMLDPSGAAVPTMYAQSTPPTSGFDLGRSPFGAGRLTPDCAPYDLQPQYYPTTPTATGMPIDAASRYTGSPVTSAASSPKTPTFGLSPLSASLPPIGLSNQPLPEFRPQVGLPGSNGTSAFTVVAPRNNKQQQSPFSSAPTTPSSSAPSSGHLADLIDKIDKLEQIERLEKRDKPEKAERHHDKRLKSSPPSSPTPTKKKKRRENN